MSNLSERLPESKIIEFLESDDECTVELDLLIELSVYSRKDHAVTALKRSFVESVDFSRSRGKTPSGGRPSDSYLLTSYCFRHMCQLADTEMGRLVRDYYISIERRWKEHRKSQSINPKSLAETILLIGQQMVENELRQQELEAKQKQLESRTEIVENKVAALNGASDYSTVRGYCRVKRIKISERMANSVGRTAGKICRKLNYPIGKVPDEKHGIVNSYPDDVLAEAIASVLRED
jgi:phage anti-repressor protein